VLHLKDASSALLKGPCYMTCHARHAAVPNELTEMCTIQAGVAMGLAKTVAVRFPEWGPDFATLMVSVAAMQPVLQQSSEGVSCLQVHAQPSRRTTCRFTISLAQYQSDIVPDHTCD
jgi:hypothetical protein